MAPSSFIRNTLTTSKDGNKKRKLARTNNCLIIDNKQEFSKMRRSNALSQLNHRWDPRFKSITYLKSPLLRRIKIEWPLNITMKHSIRPYQIYNQRSRHQMCSLPPTWTIPRSFSPTGSCHPGTIADPSLASCKGRLNWDAWEIKCQGLTVPWRSTRSKWILCFLTVKSTILTGRTHLPPFKITNSSISRQGGCKKIL